MASDNANVAGQRLGKFRMIRRLGVGGMGAVYLAEDTERGRQVAVKILPRERAANNPTLVRRFKAEAQAAARLDHDHIVRVYEAGEIAGYLYIALEYIDGIDVHELVRRKGVLPIRRTIDIVRQVAEALEHAYRRNIVHRDIKPSNLLIQRDGTVKLADLGLARAVDETANTGITRAGTTVGTVDYMAPEQAHNSKAADTRSDIYSLGCTWYHMLTGQPPFPEGSLINKITAHATQPPPDPRKINPAVPESVVRVMHKMMAKRPDDRYQTPRELIDAIDEILRQQKAQRRSVASKASDELVLQQMAAEALQEAERERAAAEAEAGAAGTRGEEKDEEFEFVPRPRGRSVAAWPPKRRKKPAGRQGLPVWLPWAAATAALVLLVGLAVALIPRQGGSAPSDQSESVASTRNEPAGLSGGDGTSPEASKTGDNQPAEGGVRKTPDKPAETPGSTPPAPRSSGAAPKGRPPGEAERFDIARADSRFSFPWRAAALPSLSEWSRPAVDIEPAWWKAAATGTLAPQPSLVEDDFTEFTSLNAAVRRHQAQDVVLHLVGQGPYRIAPDDWSHFRSIAIRSTGEPKDVVIDLSQVGEKGAVRLGRCSLALENLRLWIAPPQSNTPETAFRGIFASAGGDIAFVRCVVQPLEALPAPLVLCKIDASRDGGRGAARSSADGAESRGPAARVLFERSVVWCPRLSVLGVRSCSLSLALHRSLLVVPDATALSVTTDQRAAPVAFDLRVAACSLLVGRKLCAFEVGAPPLGLSIATVASVLATTDPQGELVSAANWPVNQIIEAGRTRLRRATWLAEHSVLVGWKRLLTTSPFVTESVPTAESWQTIWGRASGVRFIPAGDATERPISVPATEWTVADHLQQLAGGSAGCAVTDLPSVDARGLVRVSAYRRRAVLEPSRFGPGSPRMEVDLGKTPLEEALGRRAWADGTVFVVRGAGRHRVRPIVIDGRSLRIEFESLRPEEPLILQPVPSRRGGSNAEAMFTVRNADVEIVGATVEFPATFRADGTPARWLAVSDGGFLLHGCQVYGPTVDGVGFDALVTWTGAGVQRSTPGRGHRGVVRDSYLIGRCPLLSAQVRGRELLIRNALLVSDGPAVVLDIRGLSADIDAIIDVAQSTFCAARAFDVKTVPLAERARRPCRFSVIRSVFAPPPIDVASGPSCVLAAPPAALEHAQLEWFGDTNGFGPGVLPLCGAAAAETASDPLAAWVERWGDRAVLDPVSGKDAVRWHEPLRMKTRPWPDQFRLDPQCAAATAGVGGRALGCDPRRWPRPVADDAEKVTRR